MACAIWAGQEAARVRPLNIVVLDGAKKIGAKILVAGGGRCNITHDQVTAEDYFGPRNVIKNVLAGFTADDAMSWFDSMGVRTKRERTGKIFPVSDDAAMVLEALLKRCGELGVEIRTGRKVADVEAHGLQSLGFRVRYEGGTISARRVVMATGGKSLPKSGSDGAGWGMVRKLGHSVTEVWRALVPLVFAPGTKGGFSELSGVSQEVELSVFVEGKLAERRRGSMLWTHFGVSGPVVMDVSRVWTTNRGAGKAVRIEANLMPGADYAKVDQWLVEAIGRGPRRGVVSVLSERLPRSVAENAARRAAAQCPELEMGELTRDLRRALVKELVAVELPVSGDRGWNYAEVTAGGVPMSEVNFRTMESRVVPGLYLVGEMLDVDGRIGGFNFQWAWATGKAAGVAAVKGLEQVEANESPGKALPGL